MTHVTKSVHMNGGKSDNLRSAHGKRNSPSLLILAASVGGNELPVSCLPSHKGPKSKALTRYAKEEKNLKNFFFSL